MHSSDAHDAGRATVEDGGPVSFEDRVAAARTKREARLRGLRGSERPATDRTRVAVAFGLPVPPRPASEPAPAEAALAPTRARRIRGGLVAAAVVLAAIVSFGGAHVAEPPESAPFEAASLLATRPAPPAEPRPEPSRQVVTALAASKRPAPAATPAELHTRSAMRRTGPDAARPWTGRSRMAPEPVARVLPIRLTTSASAALPRSDASVLPIRVSMDRVVQRAEAPSAFGRRPAERPEALASADPPEAARATPPRTRPPPVPAEPVNAPLGRPTVFIHVPPGVSAAAVERVSRGLFGADPADIRVIPVAFRISSTHVRYYRPADARVAEAVRAAVARAYPGRRDGSPRDFSFYEPRPAPGTIEVWLLGG